MARRGRRLLTVGEACQYLGVSRMTLLAAEESGLLAPSRTPGGHRRYDPAELDRFLNRGRPSPASVPVAGGPPSRQNGPVPVTGSSRLLLREAIRRLTLLLRADAAGLYLLDERQELGWCTSFGIPQWRTAQLAQSAPPRAVVRALMKRQCELFESSSERFPLPTARGSGAAVPLETGDEPLGVVIVTVGQDRHLLPSEIEIIETAAFYIGVLVRQQRRLDTLEARLASIHHLTAGAQPPAVHDTL